MRYLLGSVVSALGPRVTLLRPGMVDGDSLIELPITRLRSHDDLPWFGVSGLRGSVIRPIGLVWFGLFAGLVLCGSLLAVDPVTSAADEPRILAVRDRLITVGIDSDAVFQEGAMLEVWSEEGAEKAQPLATARVVSVGDEQVIAVLEKPSELVKPGHKIRVAGVESPTPPQVEDPAVSLVMQGKVRDAIGRYMAVIIDSPQGPCPGAEIEFELIDPAAGDSSRIGGKATVVLLEGREILVQLPAGMGTIDAGWTAVFKSDCQLKLANWPVASSATDAAVANPNWIGLQIENHREEVRVRSVWPDSPASRAGFHAGDRLLRADGLIITDMRSFVAITGKASDDTPVSIDILRDGNTLTLPVTVETRPNDAELRRRMTELAAQGNHDAEFRLGMLYAERTGATASELAASNQWLRKAAEAQLPEAELELGRRLLLGRGTEKNVAEGVRWIEKAADRGFAPAQFLLGRIYLGSQGVTRDPAAAMRRYSQALEDGYLPAMTEMGLLFERGELVAKDLQEAARLLRAAALRGDALAAYHYGRLLDTQVIEGAEADEAVWWIKQAVNAGNHDAEYLLGDLYQAGRRVEMDLPQAFEFFERAARGNHPGGMYRVGWCYARGQGVAASDSDAVTWYRRGAEAGVPEAQMELGVHYAQGRGVSRDDAQAFTWIKRSAEQGHARAQYNVAFLYLEGRGTAKDLQQANAWCQKAADAGDAHGENLMGVLCSQGLGRPLDARAAVAWFQKAADKGLAKAKTNLGLMYAEGQGVERNLETARRWLREAAEQGDASASEALKHLE